MITVYHPVTELLTEVPEESLPHLRAGGWITLADRDEIAARKAEREAEAEAAAKTAAGKSDAKAASKPDSQEK